MFIYFITNPFLVQFYLPPDNTVNKDFLKMVFAGAKQLLKKKDVQKIKVSCYDELSVKALYPQFTKDPAMMQYFPDVYPKGKGPPREYFFNILNTVHPDYLSQIMAHADQQRFTT